MAARDYRSYVRALNQASLLAQRDFEKLWAKVRSLTPRACRNVLVEAVPGIVYKYGQMAALAAAEYYESERSAARPGEGFDAELSDGVPIEQITNAVRYACGHLFPEDGSGAQPEQDSGLFGGGD